MPQDRNDWSFNLLKNLLLSSTSFDSLSKTVINLFDRDDKLIWTLDPSGHYTTKSGCFLLASRNISPTPLSRYHSKTFWKRLWKLRLPYKLIFFLWKILHNSLPLKHELQKRIPITDTHYSLCGEKTLRFEIMFF